MAQVKNTFIDISSTPGAGHHGVPSPLATATARSSFLTESLIAAANAEPTQYTQEMPIAVPSTPDSTSHAVTVLPEKVVARRPRPSQLTCGVTNMLSIPESSSQYVTPTAASAAVVYSATPMVYQSGISSIPATPANVMDVVTPSGTPMAYGGTPTPTHHFTSSWTTTQPGYAATMVAAAPMQAPPMQAAPQVVTVAPAVYAAPPSAPPAVPAMVSIQSAPAFPAPTSAPAVQYAQVQAQVRQPQTLSLVDMIQSPTGEMKMSLQNPAFPATQYKVVAPASYPAVPMVTSAQAPQAGPSAAVMLGLVAAPQQQQPQRAAMGTFQGQYPRVQGYAAPTYAAAPPGTMYQRAMPPPPPMAAPSTVPQSPKGGPPTLAPGEAQWYQGMMAATGGLLAPGQRWSDV